LRQSTPRHRRCAVLAGALIALTLAGCGGTGKGEIGYVEGFLGGVVAPEPRSALIGRDVLSTGGNAVDAAVATYFALAVTLPTSAGLGGGGACLVHDFLSRETDALLFPIGTPSAPSDFAIPGNVRGMFALHARYGDAFWADLLTPAERLAREGTFVSRALATELRIVEEVVRDDPVLYDTFMRDFEGMADKGDLVRQLPLATTLAALRSRGAGEFYGGLLARQLESDATDIGGTLTVEDLRNHVPTYRPTLKVDYGSNTMHFTPPPANSGAVAAQLWALTTQTGLLGGARDDTHVFLEAAERIYAGRPGWPPSVMNGDPAPLLAAPRLAGLRQDIDPRRHTPAAELRPPPRLVEDELGGAGFIVVDRSARAVACTVSMNGLMGAGRVGPTTGAPMAQAPLQTDLIGTPLGAAMLVNNNSGNIFFAATAAGGTPGATAMTDVAQRVLAADETAVDAVAAPRAHTTGAPDIAWLEDGFPAEGVARLRSLGHTVQPVRELGRVNVLHCPQGLPREAFCIFVPESRGHGLAASDE